MAWIHKNKEEALICIKNFLKNERMVDNLLKKLLIVFDEEEILNMMDDNNNHTLQKSTT